MTVVTISTITINKPDVARTVAVLGLSVWGVSGDMVLGWGIQSEQLQVSYYEPYYASLWF